MENLLLIVLLLTLREMQGGDASTAIQLFGALTTGRLLPSVSVHLGSIKSGKVSTSKIPSITGMFDFVFNNSGILANRYHGIGERNHISSERLVPNDCRFVVEISGGFVGARQLLEDEREAYWMAFKWKGLQEPEEIIAIEDIVDDESNDSDVLERDAELHSKQLFECPEETCSASFFEFPKSPVTPGDWSTSQGTRKDLST